ncbi:MAG TPA: hypothetical protein VFC78_11325 [Tepidisphaeraceae bacterium]|nr:hypothetical protein [Tepidisphaeraceae bacterium]
MRQEKYTYRYIGLDRVPSRAKPDYLLKNEVSERIRSFKVSESTDFIVRYRPLASDRPAEYRLRRELKHALRSEQLRCIDFAEVASDVPLGGLTPENGKCGPAIGSEVKHP